ncbi:hypothetical protein ACU686_24145 [Yinghuangia aomiensis]
MYGRYSSDGGSLSKPAGLQSKALADLLAQGNATNDDAARKTIYGNLQKQLLTESPWVWMFRSDDYYLVKSGVQGFTPRPDELLTSLAAVRRPGGAPRAGTGACAGAPPAHRTTPTTTTTTTTTTRGADRMLTWRWFAARFGGAVLTLLGVTVVVFVVLRTIPGDAVTASLGTESGTLTPAQRESLNHYYGIDKSWFEQLWTWISGIAHGDLGLSTTSGKAVTELLGTALPVTVEIAALAALMGTAAGIVLGVLAGARAGRTSDTATQGAAHGRPRHPLSSSSEPPSSRSWPKCSATSRAPARSSHDDRLGLGEPEPGLLSVARPRDPVRGQRDAHDPLRIRRDGRSRLRTHRPRQGPAPRPDPPRPHPAQRDDPGIVTLTRHPVRLPAGRHGHRGADLRAPRHGTAAADLQSPTATTWSCKARCWSSPCCSSWST